MIEKTLVGVVAALFSLTVLCLFMAAVAAVFGPTSWWPLALLIPLALTAGAAAGARWDA